MNKYTEKKKKSQVFSHYVNKHVSDSMKSLISSCGDWWAFVADESKEKKKVYASNSCGNRFCPICRWREAKKDAMRISILMKYIQQEHEKDFIFLTLTAPNVTGDKLGEEITKYNKAFKELMRRKEVSAIVKGYVRKLEVTYNADRKDFHPHFHVMIAVNKSYFTDRTYIKQAEWLRMWREVMDDYSITQVDVRRFKGDTEKEVLEIATYATKDDDLYANEIVFDYYYKALKGRQIITYGGLFADANKLYKAKKLEHYKEIDQTEYVYMILYTWGMGEYVEKECRELTEDERERVNRQILHEIQLE